MLALAFAVLRQRSYSSYSSSSVFFSSRRSQSMAGSIPTDIRLTFSQQLLLQLVPGLEGSGQFYLPPPSPLSPPPLSFIMHTYTSHNLPYFLFVLNIFLFIFIFFFLCL